MFERLADRLGLNAIPQIFFVSALLAVSFVLSNFPRGLILVTCAVMALALAWYGLVSAGPARMVGFAGAAIVLAVA